MTRIAIAIFSGLFIVAIAIKDLGRALSHVTVNSTTRVKIEKEQAP